MPIRLSNNAIGFLTASAAIDDTSFSLGSGDKFPTLSAGEYCYVRFGWHDDNEIIKVTARSGDVFTCEAFTQAWGAGTLCLLPANTEVMGTFVKLESEWETLFEAELTNWATTVDEVTISGGVLTLDLTQGNAFQVELTENITTLNITNAVDEGQLTYFTLLIKQSAAGGNSIIWPDDIWWPGGHVPIVSITPNVHELYSFLTIDSSVRWLGKQETAATVFFPKGYIFNGYNIYDTEEYDPNTDLWTTKQNIINLRYGCAASGIDSKAYCYGGYQPSANKIWTDEYDPNTDVWTRKANMLDAARNSGSCTLNQKGYIFGGYGTSAGKCSEYNSQTNNWAAKTALNHSRAESGATEVLGKAYLFGGEYSGRLLYNDEYNASSNTWAAKTDMSGARFDNTHCTIEDKGYTWGGRTTNFIKDNDEYNPLTNTWAAKTDIIVADSSSVAFGISNYGYMAAGSVGTNDTYQYSVVSNSWIAKSDLNVLYLPQATGCAV